MNPGTFYLYEYEDSRRRRNVGFIKVARHYRSCIIQIHARGIPVGNGASLELHAFYRDGDDLVSEQIAALNCFGRNISIRLPVTEFQFPEGRSLMEIDGFLIVLPGSKSSPFWMASSFFFNADISRMRSPSAEPAAPDIQVAEETIPPENPSPQEADTEEAENPEPPQASAEEPPISQKDVCAEETKSFETSTAQTVRKIQRSDIAKLPRKFWPLANNSFLLHGYHNYSHLLLIEEGGRLWLGVPGIYDPKEARAADLFGFPRFTRSCAKSEELTEEECSDSQDFGHWCRCIGPQSMPFIS